MYQYQFGFLKGKSTNDALVELTERIYGSLNKNEFNLNLYLDLKKAFDTVSHQILIKKLEYYGVRGLPLSLFESFLSERSQYVKIGKEISSLRQNTIGIPQGSNLGPVLFLIYVNDICGSTATVDPILFADDTTLINSNSDYDALITEMNSDLTSIKKWTLANRLTVNVQKTNAIVFSNKLKPDNTENRLLLSGEEVQFADAVKYLGVYIDSKLKFGEHIRTISGKLARNTGLLYHIRHNLPMTARLNYYYGFIFPFLNYNIILWGGTYSSHLNCLEVQHKRTIRTLADLPYLSHTSPTFKKLGILKLNDLYRYNLCIFVFKNRDTINFWSRHDYNTRLRNNAVPSFNRLTISQRSVYYMGPKCWNELPDSLKIETKLASFKKNLKKFYLSFY